ncbi:MAG: carbonic anhydrase family protein [Rhodospirillales bacterium]|nr:carbonic anhydrase family protein [Rhodospirillales bacterium]
MIQNKPFLFAAAALLTASVISGGVMASGSGPHWTYEGHEGPANWGELSPEFAACGAGKMQSPVDLADANADGQVTVDFNYSPAELEILNNGHTVQFNVANGSTMTSEGKTYTLAQVHFHTPSEHPISGKPFAMEAHFVHKAEDGQLAVVGVFFNEGASNAALKDVFTNAGTATAHEAKVAGASVDLRGVIPASPTFYRYMGSLTTPPCSEGVNWFVVKEPVEASAAEIAAMTKAFGHNARPAQNANARKIMKPAN